MYIWPNYLLKTQYEQTAAPAFVAVMVKTLTFDQKKNPFYLKMFYLLTFINVFQIQKYLVKLGKDAVAA